MNSLLQAVREYLRRGHVPVPAPPREKGPRLQNWHDLGLVEADKPTHLGNGDNVVSGAAHLSPSLPAHGTTQLTGSDVAVLRMARRGLRLFPVQAHGKHPLVAEWPQKATCDVETLRAWSHQFPG